MPFDCKIISTDPKKYLHPIPIYIFITTVTIFLPAKLPVPNGLEPRTFSSPDRTRIAELFVKNQYIIDQTQRQAKSFVKTFFTWKLMFYFWIVWNFHDGIPIIREPFAWNKITRSQNLENLSFKTLSLFRRICPCQKIILEMFPLPNCCKHCTAKYETAGLSYVTVFSRKSSNYRFEIPLILSNPHLPIDLSRQNNLMLSKLNQNIQNVLLKFR